MTRLSRVQQCLRIDSFISKDTVYMVARPREEPSGIPQDFINQAQGRECLVQEKN